MPAIQKNKKKLYIVGDQKMGEGTECSVSKNSREGGASCSNGQWGQNESRNSRDCERRSGTGELREMLGKKGGDGRKRKGGVFRKKENEEGLGKDEKCLKDLPKKRQSQFR